MTGNDFPRAQHHHQSHPRSRHFFSFFPAFQVDKKNRRRATFSAYAINIRTSVKSPKKKCLTDSRKINKCQFSSTTLSFSFPRTRGNCEVQSKFFCSDARRHFFLLSLSNQKGVRGIRNRWKQKSIIPSTLITQQTDEKWEGGVCMYVCVCVEWLKRKHPKKRWESRNQKKKRRRLKMWADEASSFHVCYSLNFQWQDKLSSTRSSCLETRTLLTDQFGYSTQHLCPIPSLPFILIIPPNKLCVLNRFFSILDFGSWMGAAYCVMDFFCSVIFLFSPSCSTVAGKKKQKHSWSPNYYKNLETRNRTRWNSLSALSSVHFFFLLLLNNRKR